MKKGKLLFENILVYGFGGILGRVIPLIMVPIITRLLPDTAYYGISDLTDTIVQLGCAFAVFGMFDALYRMFFEKEDEAFRKECCSTALALNLVLSITVFGILIVFREQFAQFVFKDTSFSYLVVIAAISTLIGSTNNIISAPTRMQNKRKQYLLIHFLSPVVSYCLAIPLILRGYYYLALPLAAMISALLVEVSFYILNRKWFKIGTPNWKLLKQMLSLALPMFPNLIIYWLFNSADKLMISNMLGAADVGIYSAGAKIAHISQIFFTAFATGWQYVAFSTMKDENQVKSNSRIFTIVSIIAYSVFIFACSLDYFAFNIVFTGDYRQGYLVMPLLFMSPLLQMMYQICCSQLLISKSAWPNIIIMSSGAVINVFLNYFLIPIMGIEGAAFATFIGYLCTVVAIVIVLISRKQMVLYSDFYISTLVTVGFYIIWRVFFRTSTFGILLGLIGLAIIVLVNREKLITFSKVIISRVRKSDNGNA